MTRSDRVLRSTRRARGGAHAQRSDLSTRTIGAVSAASPNPDSVESLEGVVARYSDAWNRRDVDAILALHAPGMVFENQTGRERAEGEDVRAELERVFAVWPDLVFATRRREIRAGLVVEEWTATATHSTTLTSRGRAAKPTGQRVEWRGVDVLTFEGGLVKRKDFYMDTLAVLRQVGLAD